MDDRKLFILGAILQSYIKGGQPIGSRTLQREYQMDISAATIRNEMSDLEYLGYLQKAHTSSGRIPADKAYRWYVDELLRRGLHEDHVPALGSRSLLKQSYDPETLLNEVLMLLSDLTDTVSFAVIPGRSDDVLETIRFMPLSPKELMIVVVFDSKFVQTELIHLEQPTSEDRLIRFGEIVQELFEGRTLESVSDFLASDYFSGTIVPGNLMSEVLPVFLERLRGKKEPRVLFQGLGKWFRLVGDRDPEEALRRLEEISETQSFLETIGSLPDANEVQVKIGGEHASSAWDGLALVSMRYQLHKDVTGRLGVIGPMRMQYRQVLADVKRLGRYVSSITGRK